MECQEEQVLIGNKGNHDFVSIYRYISIISIYRVYICVATVFLTNGILWIIN